MGLFSDLIGGKQVKAPPYAPFGLNTPLGSTSFSGNTGTATLTPELQSIMDRLFGASSGLFDKAETFDTQAAIGKRLDLLRQLSAPVEDRQRTELENRLFRQGRLGSTGGGLDQRALFRSQSDADMARQLAAIESGEGLQQRLFGTALKSLGAGLGIGDFSKDLFRIGGQLGGFAAQANQFNADLEAKRQGKIGDFFSGLISSAASAWNFGAPKPA